MFDAERGFLSKLFETKDISLIKEQQIKASFFTGESKQLFNFFLDSFLKNGELPTERVINQYFPDYTFETFDNHIGTEENLLFWCHEVRRKAKHNYIADSVEEIAKNIDAFKTDEAFTQLKKCVSFIEGEISETSAVDITKNTEDRVQRYLKRKEQKGMVGLPTGIQHLDNMIRGLEKETLTLFMAKTGIGKTFLEVLIGSYCMLNGCKVLQCMTEMGTEIMQDRYDAMLFGMMYGDFNYSHFKSGKLSKEKEEDYFTFLRKDLPRLEPLILKNITSAVALKAEIELSRPDIVLIDGIYLMEDDQGARSDWERFTHITRDVKKLAKQEHLPIVANTQSDIKGKDIPSLADVKYSQSTIQDADTVISLYRDAVMINDKELGMKIQKLREGVPGKVVINWDFDTMNFSGIYSERETSESDDAEESAEESNSVLGIE